MEGQVDRYFRWVLVCYMLQCTLHNTKLQPQHINAVYTTHTQEQCCIWMGTNVAKTTTKMMQKNTSTLQNLLIHLGVDLTKESVYLRRSKADVTVVTDDDAECLFGLSLSPAQCGILNFFRAVKGLPL